MPRIRSRPQIIPPPAPIMQIILPSDLVTALDAAKTKLSVLPDKTALEAACTHLNVAFHHLVKMFSSPVLTDIEGTAKALRDMSEGCNAALKPLAFRLHQMPDDTSSLIAFGRELADANDPMIVALRDASAALDGPTAGGDQLVLALAMVRYLGRWADAAASQFESGFKAAEAGRKADLRQQYFHFATFVFAAYTQLTGEALQTSRHPLGHPEEGKPSGPLIRFTLALYDGLRDRCRNHPELMELADLTGLNPKAETIAAWVTDAKKPHR